MKEIMHIARMLCGAAALAASGCSTTRHDQPGGEVARGIAELRIEEIARQAALIGIPLERASAVRLAGITICEETGRNADGSYTCDDCTGETSDCIHAYCMAAQGGRSVRYMFAGPDIKRGTLSHEFHHELVVTHYGISGHPRSSVVTRLDNGQRMTIDHASVIGWRWPALVNWALPQKWEVGGPWGGRLNCGADERFEEGGGI